MIEYDCVIDENGRRVFGEIPGEVYMWCFRKENRESNLTVKIGRTGEEVSVEDYLYKVEMTVILDTLCTLDGKEVLRLSPELMKNYLTEYNPGDGYGVRPYNREFLVSVEEYLRLG